jgi:hypothetical protein
MSISSSIKNNILMYSGNGYCFEEVYLPLIEINHDKWSIDLLISEYYLTERIQKLLKYLLSSKKINSYQVVPQMKPTVNFYYFIKSLQRNYTKQYNILLMGSDYYPIDRYLIDLVRFFKKCRVVIINTSTLWRLHHELQIERSTISKGDHQVKIKFFRKIQAIGCIGVLFAILKRLDNVFKKSIRFCINLFNYYLFPLLLVNKAFLSCKYDKYVFAGGRGDAVILFDEGDAKVFKNYIPDAKNVVIARHPLSDYDNPYKVILDSKTKKILITFAQNLDDEMSPDNIEKWIIAINHVAKLKNIQEIHLRCHPRTSKFVQWTSKISNKLNQLGYTTLLIDPSEISFLNSLSNYCGVLGAPSGSLIVARASSNELFVACLPNSSSGGPDDQSWILGSAEGIVFINENDISELKDVYKEDVNYKKLPSTSEVINSIISNDKLVTHQGCK